MVLEQLHVPLTIVPVLVHQVLHLRVLLVHLVLVAVSLDFHLSQVSAARFRFEEIVIQSVNGSEPTFGIQNEKFIDQVDGKRIVDDALENFDDVPGLVFRRELFRLFVFADTGPYLFVD